ncbi:hypothetical protein C3L33_02842, partial [Rhododendron williamsianum]
VEGYPFEQSLSNEKRCNGVLPRSHFVEVPLINQQRTWDCGLACVLMVLTLENSWHRSTSGEEMSLLILTGKFVAIALVDQCKLRVLASFDVVDLGCDSGYFSCSSGYTGGY